LPFGPGVMSSE